MMSSFVILLIAIATVRKMSIVPSFWLQKLEQVWGLVYLRATIEKERGGGAWTTGGHSKVLIRKNSLLSGIV